MLELVPIGANVRFYTVALLLADRSFLHKLVEVLLQLLLEGLDLSHLRFHLEEVLLFRFKLSLALHFDFLASLTVVEELLTRCLILVDLLLKFILLLTQLRDVVLGSVDLAVELADII